MNFLIAAATALEISPFLNYYAVAEKNNADILVTGIGLTATTFSLTKQIQIRRPDMIIQAGLAGCFDTKIPLGTIVVVKQEAIADESVIELKKLKSLFDLKLVPQDQPPYKKGWLVNPATALLNKTRLRIVKGISVNQITTDPAMIRFYKNHFDPFTESMEGAALHYVCLKEKIPFLQLRSISNYTGERNKKKWNMKVPIGNLNRELVRLTELL